MKYLLKPYLLSSYNEKIHASAKVTRLGSIRWCGHISFAVCKLKRKTIITTLQVTTFDPL